MTAAGVDPALAAAWFAARSVARKLPAPVADRGGLRVDTGGTEEICRWFFARATPSITEIARSVSAPGYFIKLCGTRADIEPLAPTPWVFQPPQSRMMITRDAPRADALPPGYRAESRTDGAVTHVRIFDAESVEAARGYAAEAGGVFVYDRIATSPSHRRLGLGRALMSMLGSARRSSASQQILVATEDGYLLYSALGWKTYSPYATITVPRAT